MCLQTAPENVNGLGTLDGERERVPQRRGGMRKITLCQNLPSDNEVLSRDVYPKIVETSQVCRATVANKAEPCNFEPCRPATGSCNLFWTQLVANVDLSILVLYGHISIRRQCVQHYSGNVVAETLSIHWYQTEGCCNNLSGVSLPNSSFFQSGVCRGTFDGIQLIFWQILFTWSFKNRLNQTRHQGFWVVPYLVQWVNHQCWWQCLPGGW